MESLLNWDNTPEDWELAYISSVYKKGVKKRVAIIEEYGNLSFVYNEIKDYKIISNVKRVNVRLLYLSQYF